MNEPKSTDFVVKGANREGTGVDYQIRWPDGTWHGVPGAHSYDEAHALGVEAYRSRPVRRFNSPGYGRVLGRS